jgi:hypothetical protein
VGGASRLLDLLNGSTTVLLDRHMPIGLQFIFAKFEVGVPRGSCSEIDLNYAVRVGGLLFKAFDDGSRRRVFKPSMAAQKLDFPTDDFLKGDSSLVDVVVTTVASTQFRVRRPRCD